MPAALPRIAAVVLAAGASTRLGHPKQLVLHDGEPLVRRAALAAAHAGASPVVVVLGAHADIIAPRLTGLESVRVVVNDRWEQGLASSLAAGLHASGITDDDTRVDGVLVSLADQPLVDGPALRRLLAALSPAQRVAAATYDDVLGVPAVFGREHVADLLRLTGDAGAGAWLRRHASLVTPVPMPGAALDVDTASDVERLRTRTS